MLPMGKKQKRTLTEDELRAKLAAACSASGSQNRWAAQHGIQQSVVSETISGERKPGPTVLRALGYAPIVKYQKADAWDDVNDAFTQPNPLEKQK